jgi:hypothetical protein
MIVANHPVTGLSHGGRNTASEETSFGFAVVIDQSEMQIELRRRIDTVQVVEHVMEIDVHLCTLRPTLHSVQIVSGVGDADVKLLLEGLCPKPNRRW